MQREVEAREPIAGEARGAARTLALIRIVAGLVIASSADIHAAPRFAALDPVLSALPDGLAWLQHATLSVSSANVLRWVVVGAALAGAVGCYARAAWAVTALGALVLLGLPQRLGAVTHSHHLLWVAALLALSPCAEVWSADAYFEPRPLRARGCYALPIALVRALVAAIYFFPGVHKLVAFLHGVEPAAWFRAQLDWKWMQAGHAADLPFALTPTVVLALALGAVAFELSMPLLVMFRRTRPWALLGAIAFHLATAKLLFIRFDSLAAVLVSLIDLGPRSRRQEPMLASFRASWQSTRWLGGALLLGVCATGALGLTQAYPFACYPTFAEQPPARMPSARVEVTTPAGRCLLPRPRSNADWMQAFRIAGAYGDALTELRARAYLRQQLRAHRADCPIEPDSLLALTLEQLVWSDATQSVRVASERRVYETTASSLGSAPDDGASGTSASSSPPK